METAPEGAVAWLTGGFHYAMLRYFAAAVPPPTVSSVTHLPAFTS
jgi:hypothetical protein